jgi:hypothetical protein
VTAGVVTYMLLCWVEGGGCLRDWFDIFGTFCSRRGGGGLVCPQGFAMCAWAHLVFCGRKNKRVKCGNGVNLCGVCVCLYVSKVVGK